MAFRNDRDRRSSAIVTLLLGEPLQDRVASVLGAGDLALMSAANWLESNMVLIARRGDRAVDELRRFRRDTDLQIVPMDEGISETAIEAFRRYGRGRHPARLNFGDCIAYATAKALAAPLLFVGDDFRATDVEPAL